jgi:hypothetical protein
MLAPATLPRLPELDPTVPEGGEAHYDGALVDADRTRPAVSLLVVWLATGAMWSRSICWPSGHRHWHLVARRNPTPGTRSCWPTSCAPTHPRTVGCQPTPNSPMRLRSSPAHNTTPSGTGPARARSCVRCCAGSPRESWPPSPASVTASTSSRRHQKRRRVGHRSNQTLRHPLRRPDLRQPPRARSSHKRSCPSELSDDTPRLRDARALKG